MPQLPACSYVRVAEAGFLGGNVARAAFAICFENKEALVAGACIRASSADTSSLSSAILTLSALVGATVLSAQTSSDGAFARKIVTAVRAELLRCRETKTS